MDERKNKRRECIEMGWMDGWIRWDAWDTCNGSMGRMGWMEGRVGLTDING